jgi:hypothetical protein
MLPGLIEIISPNFAAGWARLAGQWPSHVYASLGDRIIGCAAADIRRNDLRGNDTSAAGTADPESAGEMGRGFIVLFNAPVAPDALDQIKLTMLESAETLLRGNRARYDRRDPLQVFVLGSPRSGTSEMGQTLASVLQLPWVGEGHAAPAFQDAASALNGERAPSRGALTDFMRYNALGSVAERAMRQTYYYVHRASSFLDKTPGVEMIRAAPFLSKSFPAAKFIFMRRNGISNVLSRMQKFGGDFHAHCSDWAAAMNAWLDVRARLPHYVEIEQEVMLERPTDVANAVAGYLGVSEETTNQIASSLAAGALERTGAGIGRDTFASAGWDRRQIDIFMKIDGPVMREFGYSFN